MDEQIKSDEQKILEQNVHDFHHKKHRRNFLIIIVLSLLLLVAGGVLAQYSTKQILRCGTPGTNGLCFDLEAAEDSSSVKFGLKNISSDKKYRFVLKRKVNSSEMIEVGSVVVDMSSSADISKGTHCLEYNQSSDSLTAACCGDLQKMSDNLSKMSVCCKKGECSDGLSCFQNLAIYGNKKCQNGSWASDAPGGQFCKDSDGGKNYTQKGSASFYANNVTGNENAVSTLEDRCVGDYLLEYYCDGNSLREERLICKIGHCSDGFCHNDCEGAACECMNIGQYSNDKNATCCAIASSPLYLRSDYENKGDENDNFICCASGQCALDLKCVDNGFFLEADDLYCANGEWAKK